MDNGGCGIDHSGEALAGFIITHCDPLELFEFTQEILGPVLN
jgi:hypothetical protein